MASPRLAVTPETYDDLADFYLALWEQLDRAMDDSRYFEIRPVSASDLRDRAEKMLQMLRPDSSSPVFKDYKKTQSLVLDRTRVNPAEIASFREYLRDHALRYSELADELPVTEQ